MLPCLSKPLCVFLSHSICHKFTCVFPTKQQILKGRSRVSHVFETPGAQHSKHPSPVMPVEVELCRLLCFCSAFYLVNWSIFGSPLRLSTVCLSPVLQSLPLWVNLAFVLSVIMCSLRSVIRAPAQEIILEGGTHILHVFFSSLLFQRLIQHLEE